MRNTECASVQRSGPARVASMRRRITATAHQAMSGAPGRLLGHRQDWAADLRRSIRDRRVTDLAADLGRTLCKSMYIALGPSPVSKSRSTWTSSNATALPLPFK